MKFVHSPVLSIAQAKNLSHPWTLHQSVQLILSVFLVSHLPCYILVQASFNCTWITENFLFLKAVKETIFKYDYISLVWIY